MPCHRTDGATGGDADGGAEEIGGAAAGVLALGVALVLLAAAGAGRFPDAVPIAMAIPTTSTTPPATAAIRTCRVGIPVW